MNSYRTFAYEKKDMKFFSLYTDVNVYVLIVFVFYKYIYT